MDLEIVTWSEVSQTERQISYDIVYMWNLKEMVQVNLFTKQKQSHRCRKQNYSYQGRRGGGINWKTEIDKDREAWCAAVHVVARSWTRLSDCTTTTTTNITVHKTDTNKYLLYSTGNSTQYSVMIYMGKESKKEWTYVYV